MNDIITYFTSWTNGVGVPLTRFEMDMIWCVAIVVLTIVIVKSLAHEKHIDLNEDFEPETQTIEEIPDDIWDIYANCSEYDPLKRFDEQED